MEKIKLNFNELIQGFGDWIKNKERTNIIVYYKLEDRIVLMFNFDFKFICEVSLEDLKTHYNNPTLDNESLLNAFCEEYLNMKTISARNIIKYVI